MIKLYYAKQTDDMPGGLSGLAWRLCVYAVSRERALPDITAEPEGRDAWIVYGDHGKPYLRSDVTGGGLYFNLSHSDGFAVCAVADREIGCDLQRIGPVRESILDRFFDGRETAYISETDRDRRFARIWTMRESYAKMTGEGMHIMPDYFIDLTGGEAGVYRKADEGDAGFCRLPAAFFEVPVDPGYICVVCAENSAFFPPSIPCFNMTGVIE